MDLAKLNLYVGILSGIVRANRQYELVYEHIQRGKNKDGTVFKFLNLDGIPKLFVINSQYVLPPAVRGNTDTYYVQNVLNNLTYDFSVLSAMTTAEWVELAKHLYDSGIRAVLPEDRHSSSDTVEGQSMIKLYTEYPWVIVLLMLEVMYPVTTT